MEKHPKEIEKYSGSLEELVEDIGNLHYATLSEFLELLSNKLCLDSAKDDNAGRFKLSSTLNKASTHISRASVSILDSWNISKPYMK